MFFYLILLFTILPALEITLLIRIGIYNGILLTVITGVSGAYLARMQGFKVFQSIQADLSQGKIPTDDMLDGLMILSGGLVLLTPGLITDTVGFLLLFPVTRFFIKKFLKNHFESMVKGGTVTTFSTGSRTRKPFPAQPKDYDDADYYE